MSTYQIIMLTCQKFMFTGQKICIPVPNAKEVKTSWLQHCVSYILCVESSWLEHCASYILCDESSWLQQYVSYILCVESSWLQQYVSYILCDESSWLQHYVSYILLTSTALYVLFSLNCVCALHFVEHLYLGFVGWL